jgi:hypothetical protein
MLPGPAVFVAGDSRLLGTVERLLGAHSVNHCRVRCGLPCRQVATNSAFGDRRRLATRCDRFSAGA